MISDAANCLKKQGSLLEVIDRKGLYGNRNDGESIPGRGNSKRRAGMN